MVKKILVINLGSTSTKVAVYHDLEEVSRDCIVHSNEELAAFEDIWEQKDFRMDKIIEALKNKSIPLNSFHAIACRGSQVKPVPGGVYLLNDEMIEDMVSEKYGVHPSSVGNLIAYELGREYDIPVLMADPPVTDELCDLARFSGLKEIPRSSSFHALNQKRTARVIADQMGIDYNQLNIIVVHLGGGVSVVAHHKGRIIDVNNALDGDGPFSPERSGTLPVGALIKMCYSGEYTEQEMMKKIKGHGGLMSYLGTNSGLEVESRILSGDKYAEKVFEAMSYQVCKEIGSMAAVLRGKVDAIVLTGSLAYSERF